MRKLNIEKKEFDGNMFYFKDFGSEIHGRTSFRIWISSKLIQKDEEGREYIELPCKGQIIKTEKGTLVLKPGTNYIFDIYVACGYRGESYIEIIEPSDAKSFEYLIYHSPKGNLGVSTGMLVEANSDKIKVFWKKTGRLYGEPAEGYSVYYADGSVENISDVALKDLQQID